MTEEEVKAALSDFNAFWLTLEAEAGGEPIEGQVAVASVIRNRVGKRFGDSYKAVCLAPKQFSCWNPGDDANHVRLMALARFVIGDHAERTTIPDDALRRQLKYLAQGIMNFDLLDSTNGCDHYLTKTLFQSTPPAWAVGQTARFIASHAFLKLG